MIETPNYVYRVKDVIRVIDGDTVDLNLDVGMYITVRKRIRFLNIDTYELRGGTDETKELGRAAKARLIELLATPNAKVYIKTKMDKRMVSGVAQGFVRRVVGLRGRLEVAQDPNANGHPHRACNVEKNRCQATGWGATRRAVREGSGSASRGGSGGTRPRPTG